MTNYLNFVLTHKPCALPQVDGYKPLHIGSERSSVTIPHALMDNTGEHISEKNEQFCELTGQYWVYKNIDFQAEDIIGFSHYRRFLIRPLQYSLFKTVRQAYTMPQLENQLKNMKKRTSRLLNTYDFIVPIREKLFGREDERDRTMKSQYLNWHLSQDWETMIQALQHFYPQHQQDIQMISNYDYMFACNMFITKGSAFKDYMAWLMQILDYIEPAISVVDDPYQKRNIGFLAERLFNFYIHLNNMKYMETPVVFTDFK